MSRRIKFTHPCDVPSPVEGAAARHVEAGEVVSEAAIAPKWLAGGLKAGFCSVEPAPVPEPAPAPAPEPEPGQPIPAPEPNDE